MGRASGLNRSDYDECRSVLSGEEQFRALIEHSSDAISLVDAQGRIIYASPSTQRVLGYAPNELLGRQAFDFIHPDDLPTARLAFERLRRSPGDVLKVEARARNRGGEWRWMESTGSNLLDVAGVCAIVVNYRDITDRKEWEEQLRRRTAELEVLYGLTDALTRTLDLEQIYREALSSLERVISADRAAIVMRDPDGAVRFKAWRGLSEEYRRNIEARGIWPAEFSHSEPVVVEDVIDEPRLAHIRDLLEREGVRSLAAVPLVSGGELIGRFMLYCSHPHRFGDAEIHLATAIGDHLEAAYQRRRTEEELWESAAIIQSSSDAIFNKTLDGIILSWNPGAERLYGYTAEEVRGRPVTILFPPDKLPELEDILARLRRGERIEQLETERICKDGRRKQVQLTISPMADPSGRYWAASTIARDISERKRREATLVLLQEVAGAANEATSADAAIQRTLQGVCAYMGCEIGHAFLAADPGGPLESTALWHLRDPERFQRFREAADAISPEAAGTLAGHVRASCRPIWIPDISTVAGFRPHEAAAQAGLRSAVAFPILVGSEVAGVLEFFSTDSAENDGAFLETAGSIGVQLGRAIERHRSERALRESEARYRMITETASDAILTVDENGSILFANRSTGKIFGYAFAELPGRNISDLIPDFLQQLRQRVPEPADQHPISREPFEIGGRTRDGQEIPLEISFNAFRYEGRQAYTGVLRDITERKRMEEQFRQTQKLESLGVLAGGVAHDFNNLLTGIMGNASLALDSLPPASPVCSTLESVITASQRAADLTRQLLAYAGKGRFVVGPVNLSELVREIGNLIRASIPKSVQLRLELSEKLPPVEADSSQLQQLIMNLIINGAEAIGEEQIGTVLITTGVQDIDEHYLRSTAEGNDLAHGSYVFLEVHDTGAGMDEETKARIFDPFFTTKFTGRGLGLAAVSGIMRAHRGIIRVYSTPGQGTTFKVLFPAVASEAAGTRGTAEPRDLSGTGTVLVVDDEELVRRTASATLQRYGYAVLLAEDGQAAVDLFREKADLIDLVVLDMTMPVKGGEETYRELRHIRPHVKVILSSGYNELEAVRRFAGKGLSGFLQKPYTSAQLAEKIKSVIRTAG